MTLPKFIITMDGVLRLGMVNQHKDLLKAGDQCIGGGYYTFDYVSNRIILDRSSYDFGKPKWHLPASLRNIGYLALHVGDGHLLSIDVAKGNKHFTSRHGVLYNHDMTAILQYPCAKRRKEYVIPASVEMIAEDCFSHARHLEHVVLPEQLKTIGGSAFGFCRRLKRAWVPEGVELIQVTD